MTLCRVVFRPWREPRVTYAKVCLLFYGGCYRRGAEWKAYWCPACRRLSAERAEARKAKRRKA